MYFEKAGKDNTEQTVAAVVEYAQKHNIKHVVVASKTGDTAEKLSGHQFKVICVTYHVGFYGPGQGSLTPERRKQLEDKGISVLTTTHLMAGLDRACRFKFSGVYPAEIIASALRMFGQGTKVCIEVASMALDAGLIPYGEDVVAVAGTGDGADTALLLTPAHSNYFFDTKVREIICKPRDFEHH
ncbi:pyruvate kinase alpha/beta domain-containing protein [Desulfofalx alkaliphila]|uniref:pyruvate kinase alpha/beta domain-containing protein n=1 Tax=Desulfofalx alkaliphila TaxID=105483 RepID=UPI0004E19D4D|nr:pyruvate kinase alpha/beta domain-containing protein [Desulfofalx alkaliphila]